MRNFDAIVESIRDEDYSVWREVDSKSVLDSDGFYTDYTWYNDGDGNHIFIFGDKDIYEPDPNWADWEISGDYSEAEEWFVNYQGFTDDLEESLKRKSRKINEGLNDTEQYAAEDAILYLKKHPDEETANVVSRFVNMYQAASAEPEYEGEEFYKQDVDYLKVIKYVKSHLNESLKRRKSRKINESDEGIHHYVFCFGDGNSAASRGTEDENLCQISGDIKDVEAAAAINVLNDLPEKFNSEILHDTFNEVYDGYWGKGGGDEAFEEYSQLSIEQAISDFDISGGDPLVWLVERDGKAVFYDGDMENYLYNKWGGDEEDWDDDLGESFNRRKSRKVNESLEAPYDPEHFYYVVYELDEDGVEIDPLEAFDDFNEALEFAKKSGLHTHICLIPVTDPDDDPDSREWFEYYCEYEPYEVVWESGVNESFNGRKSRKINEANMFNQHYRYEVHAPRGENYVVGGSKDLEGAAQVAINFINDHILDSPWESLQDKIDRIDNMYLYDSDEGKIVETNSFDDYVDNVLGELLSRAENNKG